MAAADSPPPLFAGLLISIFNILLLTPAATLSLLLLLHWQILVRVIIDKLIHVTSFLTLEREKNSCYSCCIHSNLMCLLTQLTRTRPPPPPPPPFFLSLAISLDPSAKVSRFLVFSTYRALCSRSFFCSSASRLRFSSW